MQNMSETPINSEVEEIDLLELAKKIWSKRRFVGKYALIGAVAGLIIGFSIPREYTSAVKMAPEEVKSSQRSNLSNLAALAGLDLGSAEGADGINLMLYPDVVKSTPFIVELSQIPVQPQDGKRLSLYDYIDTDLSSTWWSYIFHLPMKMIGWVASIWQEEEISGSNINPKALTREQYRVLESLSKRISIDIDKKTGIITASSTMQDPMVTATVTDSMVRKLDEYMADYQTEKAKRDLIFTQESYESARDSYHEAQHRYATYMDATQNVARQSVRAEQERLRNEQTLAYSVYSQLAQQLEVAKLKVQKQTPCITIIEPAGIPTHKSNTSKIVILFIFTFLGIFIACSIVVLKELFLKKEDLEDAMVEEGDNSPQIIS